MLNLTIIIPIYNVEKYIIDCIQSIIHHLDDRIEVLCIDDGSTDQSIDILKDYLNQQPEALVKNIRIFQQKNSGVSAARNLGISHAQGTYLTFLDPDDVLLDAYFKDINLALLSNADVITFGYKKLSEDLKPSTQQFIPHLLNEKINGLQSNQNALIEIFNYNRWFSGIHVYKTSLFKDIKFPKLTHYEDAATIPNVMLKATSFYTIHKALYGYRIRSSSATNFKQASNIDKSLTCLEQLIPIFIEKTKVQAIFIIPLMHFFYIYIYQSTKFKNKQTAKLNWKKFSHQIQQLPLSGTLIKNEHNRILYHCLNLGLHGYYVSKLISRLLRSLKKRLGKPYHQ
ncbi:MULTISPECIES: glycosyltransferase [unclassified Acinetobacter]|uniref:glycosyltransferase family 2 protein n=1 Tax=unclassified Acinetobacter TaxID=196816 RepID=UPI001C2265A0|nr:MULTISPECIES: glycosyltransferase [unclassified Acinetobacter]